MEPSSLQLFSKDGEWGGEWGASDNLKFCFKISYFSVTLRINVRNLKMTHYATNRCHTSRRNTGDKSRRLHCCSDKAACAYFVAAICRTNTNHFEFVRQIAATKFCRSDNKFLMLQEAICCSNLSRRFGDLSSSVSNRCVSLTSLLNDLLLITLT